jgi:hypothetical protein
LPIYRTSNFGSPPRAGRGYINSEAGTFNASSTTPVEAKTARAFSYIVCPTKLVIFVRKVVVGGSTVWMWAMGNLTVKRISLKWKISGRLQQY